MPPLHPQTFERMRDTMTPEQAASFLLTQHKGIARNAERDIWDTWDKLVGGSPYQGRPKEGQDSYEAQLCMLIVRVITEGREDPKVERVSPFAQVRAA